MMSLAEALVDAFAPQLPEQSTCRSPEQGSPRVFCGRSVEPLTDNCITHRRALYTVRQSTAEKK